MDFFSGNDSLWLWMTPLLIFLGVIFYWYVSTPNDYWEKKGVPFVPVKPLVGSLNLFSSKASRMHELDNERYKKYGRIFGSWCKLKWATHILTQPASELKNYTQIQLFVVYTRIIAFLEPETSLSVVMSMATYFSIAFQKEQKTVKILRFHEGKIPVLVVGDPDLLRNILVKDFQFFPSRRTFVTGDPLFDNMISVAQGEQWKRLRTIITPTFSTGKIKRIIARNVTSHWNNMEMTDVILSSAKTLVQNFAEKSGKPVDSKILFSTFTMDVIASVAFGRKISSYADPNNRFVVEAGKMFGRTISWRFIVFLLFPWLIRLFRISMFKPEVAQFFKKVTLEIIEERRRTGKVGKDFLQLLMDAEKGAEEQASKTEPEVEKNTDDKHAEELGHDGNNAEIFKTTSRNKRISQDELIAQCIVFFLAGYDSVSTSLSLVCYMMALNPDIQEKLRQDVDDVIRKYNNKVTYEAVQDMKYLDKVLSETLRMFPQGFRIERLATEDYKLGDTGIVIEKGTLVMAPVYSMHHDPEFYHDPEEFIPERFTVEEKAKRHPYSYLSFGAGPRNCVGMRFALMEVKICLAYVISQLRIKRCPETAVPLDINSWKGNLQPKEIVISFEKREDRIFDGF